MALYLSSYIRSFLHHVAVLLYWCTLSPEKSQGNSVSWTLTAVVGSMVLVGWVGLVETHMAGLFIGRDIIWSSLIGLDGS